jgi:ATP-binding cassette, subfamily B (MDR/TAP), member 1
VSFGYQHTQTTLSGLTLNIKQGEKIAFVGPSGCGKSTMMQLLQRFYDCSGLILVDGVDIKDYDVHHLRSHFAIVSQEPSLFTGTLRDNLKYNLEPTQEELVSCTTKAEALKIVEESKDGYERDVGVLGSQLSGGQKQRLAIARALLRKPQILMLDEATSALDRATEMKVQANIDVDMKGKTCLVVAHRIETIQNSDRIYMFDQGEILEEGTYAELMAKKKNFYNLERGEELQRQRE